jgi:hypothetical protein
MRDRSAPRYFPTTGGRRIRHDQPANDWFGFALSSRVGLTWMEWMELLEKVPEKAE